MQQKLGNIALTVNGMIVIHSSMLMIHAPVQRFLHPCHRSKGGQNVKSATPNKPTSFHMPVSLILSPFVFIIKACVRVRVCVYSV